MDKKKTIIVKQNGKVLRESVQTSNHESAATLQESDDDQVLPIERKNKSPQVINQKKSSKFQMFKPVIIAISSAILIGSILSVIMFQVLIDVESGIAGQSLTSFPAVNDETDGETSSTNTNPSGETSSYTLEPLHAFVLQAGVFSERENADLWAENFTEIGLPTMVWQRDNQYFLLLGLAETKEEANNLVENLNTGDNDLFVKEWTTSELDLELTEQENNWLQGFHEAWQSNIGSISDTDTITKSNWESIADENIDESENLSTLVDLINNIETESGLDAHQHLLLLMHEYERLMSETGN